MGYKVAITEKNCACLWKCQIQYSVADKEITALEFILRRRDKGKKNQTAPNIPENIHENLHKSTLCPCIEHCQQF